MQENEQESGRAINQNTQPSVTGASSSVPDASSGVAADAASGTARDSTATPMKVSPSSLLPNPGDEASAGTPGTGEDTCPRCAGKGSLEAGLECPDCNGTGIVIQGIGGG